jgi:anti-anti-sigma factor
MNSNLFERKNFLEGTWITTKISECFTSNTIDSCIVVKVNLLRATASEADSLSKYFSKLPSKNISKVVLDLSECTFVDSTFLSSIIKYNKMSKAEVKLVVADKRQLSIFKITKLDALFNIYATVDQALVN